VLSRGAGWGKHHWWRKPDAMTVRAGGESLGWGRTRKERGSNIVRGVSLTTRTSCAKASESGWTWWAVGTGAGGGGGTANHCLPLTTMSPLVEESLGCVCALAATCCARTGKCACDREGGGGCMRPRTTMKCPLPCKTMHAWILESGVVWGSGRMVARVRQS
jgi:hypothetical protein